MNEAQIKRALTPVGYDKGLLIAAKEIGLKLAPNLIYPWDHVESRIPEIKIHLLQGIIDIFQKTREAAGVPLPVTSGYRSLRDQEVIRRRGQSTKSYAASLSPHCCGAALDIDIIPSKHKILGDTQRTQAETLIYYAKLAAQDLGIERWLRYGVRQYNYGFVHIDIVPILFEPEFREILDMLPIIYYPFGRSNPKPTAWAGGVTW